MIARAASLVPATNLPRRKWKRPDNELLDAGRQPVGGETLGVLDQE